MTTYSKKREQREVVLRFFSFSVNDKTFEEKKTTKIVLRFFFSFSERETRNDDMTISDESDDDNVEN
jgi:hypothetical protein